MIIRIYAVCSLLLLFTIISDPYNLAFAFPANKPKVLLFSSIDGQYLADNLEYWGNDVGANGFMLSYVAEWWSTKNEIFKNLDLLHKINMKGRQYNIDSNFIKIALGYRELPPWTDEPGWKRIIDNFRNIATLIRQSGTRGIAIDTEKYSASSLFNPNSDRFKSVKRDILKAKVYERGRQIMQAITEAYPDIEVILLAEGQFAWENNNKEYEMWIDFYKGVESVKNNQGIILAIESTYSITDQVKLTNIYNRIQASMSNAVNDHKFWQEKCSLAIGMWPLGKEYTNKAARYSPSAFKGQFLQAVALSPKYVWIYGCGAAWFQLKGEEVDKYTKDGKRIWGKECQILPTDPSIDEYYFVLRNYKKGH